MTCWVDAHWLFVWVFASDALVHLEEVSVTLFYDITPKTVDGICEVEVHAVLLRPNTLTLVDKTLCSTRRDVARRKVAERWVQTLEVVVTLVLWHFMCRTSFIRVCWNPDATIVTK